MSKYKVGDKFIIELDYPYFDNWKIKGSAEVIFTDYILNKLKKYEEDVVSKTYEDGLADAWELARKLYCDMTCGELKTIFYITSENDYENVLKKYTPQQALAKIEAYEKSQQIQVGDVVRFKDSKTEVLITSVARGLNGIHIQTDERGKVGEVNSGVCREYVEKTGKHLDIEHLLEQIRGNE